MCIQLPFSISSLPLSAVSPPPTPPPSYLDHLLRPLGGLLKEQLHGGCQQLQLHLRGLLREALQEALQQLVRVIDALRVLPDDPDHGRLASKDKGSATPAGGRRGGGGTRCSECIQPKTNQSDKCKKSIHCSHCNACELENKLPRKWRRLTYTCDLSHLGLGFIQRVQTLAQRGNDGLVPGRQAGREAGRQEVCR